MLETKAFSRSGCCYATATHTHAWQDHEVTVWVLVPQPVALTGCGRQYRRPKEEASSDFAATALR
jgi:hypothetical protein